MLSFRRTRYGMGCIGGALLIALVGCGSSSSDKSIDPDDGATGDAGSNAGSGGRAGSGGNKAGSGGSSTAGSSGSSGASGSTGGGVDAGAPAVDAASTVDAAPVPVRPEPAACTPPAGEKLYLYAHTSDEKDPVTAKALPPYIKQYAVDTATGKLCFMKKVTALKNPIFMQIDKNKNILGAVSDSGKLEGGLSTFALSSVDGSLSYIGSASSAVPKYMGATSYFCEAPVQFKFHPMGNWAITADYGGCTSFYEIDAKGMPKVKQSFKTAGTNHSASFSPDGNYAYSQVVERSSIMQFKFTGGTATPLSPAILTDTKTGPRFVATYKDAQSNQFVYIINERPFTVMSFKVGANGALTKVNEVSTINPAVKLEAYNTGEAALKNEGSSVSGGEIVVHPSGKWIYLSMRDYQNPADLIDPADPTKGMKKPAHNFIGIYSRRADGGLANVGWQAIPNQGRVPRGITVDEKGKFLFTVLHVPEKITDNTLFSYSINQDTGLLTLSDSVNSHGPGMGVVSYYPQAGTTDLMGVGGDAITPKVGADFSTLVPSPF